MAHVLLVTWIIWHVEQVAFCLDSLVSRITVSFGNETHRIMSPQTWENLVCLRYGDFVCGSWVLIFSGLLKYLLWTYRAFFSIWLHSNNSNAFKIHNDSASELNLTQFTQAIQNVEKSYQRRRLVIPIFVIFNSEIETVTPVYIPIAWYSRHEKKFGGFKNWKIGEGFGCFLILRHFLVCCSPYYASTKWLFSSEIFYESEQ